MNPKKILPFFIAACLIGWGLYAVSTVTVVVLINDEGDEKFSFSPPGGHFTVRFMHSWAMSPVYELFQIDRENNIILKGAISEDIGAGLPHSPESGHAAPSMTIEGGKIHIRGIDRIIPDLQIRTGRTVAAHTLVYGDKLVPFSDFAAPGSVVIFRVQSIRRYALWVQKIKDSI